MNQQNKRELKAGIHRYIEDVTIEVPRRFLESFCNHDVATLNEALAEWESKGYLEILKPVELCMQEEKCIRVNHYIDMKSPIPGFLD
jgi:hypothetical protein